MKVSAEHHQSIREVQDLIHGDKLIDDAVAYLKPRLPFRPKVGIVLGSGLGDYADKLPVKMEEAYSGIPGFPTCSIAGHRGRLVITDPCGVPTAILQGRVHRYEGWSLDEVTRPVRVLAALGIEIVILTCAAGGLGDLAPGSLMLVQDHLNLMGENPLRGITPGTSGESPFVEMAGAYDPNLLELAGRAAQATQIAAPRGVLACLPGPTFETPAEAAMLKRLGADAVTMSTVPEVIVARALKLRILAFALITNQSGAVHEGANAHHQVIEVACSRAEMVERVMDRILGDLAAMLAG